MDEKAASVYLMYWIHTSPDVFHALIMTHVAIHAAYTIYSMHLEIGRRRGHALRRYVYPIGGPQYHNAFLARIARHRGGSPAVDQARQRRPPRR